MLTGWPIGHPVLRNGHPVTRLWPSSGQWLSWGKTAGQTPEARQLVVAETILFFCETGWCKTFPWVAQETCENLTRITTGAGNCANRFVSTIAYNTRFSLAGI